MRQRQAAVREQQVNNLQVRQLRGGIVQVWTPDGTIMLEEFNTWERAIEWAETIKDYLAKER